MVYSVMNVTWQNLHRKITGKERKHDIKQDSPKVSPKVVTNRMDRTSTGLEILVGVINPAMHTNIGV